MQTNIPDNPDLTQGDSNDILPPNMDRNLNNNPTLSSIPNENSNLTNPDSQNIINNVPQAKLEKLPKSQGDHNWNTSNIIAFFGILISAILAWYTYQLFNQATIQSENAQKSANAAIKADSIADANYKLSKSQLETSTLENQKRIEFERKSSDQQITAMKASIIEGKRIADINRNLVEDENRAFISLDSVIIDTSNKSCIVNITVSNIGKTTAYKLRGSANCVVSIDESFLDSTFIHNFERKALNSPTTVLGTGRSISVQWPDNLQMAQNQFELLKNNPQKRVFIIAAFVYDDIYKRHHFMHLFGEYNFENADISFSYKYNDTD